MQLIVGTTPVEVVRTGRGRPIVQNLGPGNVYLDSTTTVTTTSGIKLSPGDVFEFATPSGAEDGVWVVADAANTDVRVITMGV